MTTDGDVWVLRLGGLDGPLIGDSNELGLEEGDKYLIFQEEDDFEVTATLSRKYVECYNKVCLVATPDWKTIKRFW